MNSQIFTQLCFQYFCVKVGFAIIPKLAIEILSSAFFMDNFVSGKILSEREVGLWRSQPLAILSTQHQHKPAVLQITASTSEKESTVLVDESLILIRIERQDIF